MLQFFTLGAAAVRWWSLALYNSFLKCLCPLTREDPTTTAEARPRTADCLSSILTLLAGMPQNCGDRSWPLFFWVPWRSSQKARDGGECPASGFPTAVLVNVGASYPLDMRIHLSDPVVHLAGASSARVPFLSLHPSSCLPHLQQQPSHSPK